MAEISPYSGSVAQAAPGVYLQRVAARPEPGFTSGVPLFIGLARVRPEAGGEDGNRAMRPLRLASWDEFERGVEPTPPGRFLGYAVRGFFENGGERCVVLPLRAREPLKGRASSTEDADLPEPIAALRSVFRQEGDGRGHDGLRGVLDDIDDVDLVCVPDIMIEEIRRSEESVFELQREVLEYCHDMGERFAVLDVLPAASGDGAVYVPWVRVRSLHGAGEEWVPPSGHVAGIYARSDARVGFHKAPANEIVEGIVDLESHISHEEQGPLNEYGVNCLRSFPRRGIRVWGARTLSGHRQ